MPRFCAICIQPLCPLCPGFAPFMTLAPILCALCDLCTQPLYLPSHCAQPLHPLCLAFPSFVPFVPSLWILYSQLLYPLCSLCPVFVPFVLRLCTLCRVDYWIQKVQTSLIMACRVEMSSSPSSKSTTPFISQNDKFVGSHHLPKAKAETTTEVTLTSHQLCTKKFVVNFAVFLEQIEK